MVQKTISNFGTSSRLIIKSIGDLYLTGSDSPDIVVESESEYGVKIRQEGDAFLVSLLENANITLPRAAAITIEKCSGNLSLAGLSGPVAIIKVSGDLTIGQIGQVNLEKVSGNLVAAPLNGGALQIAKVSGNACFDGAGNLSIEKISGDCLLKNQQGTFSVARISGNLIGKNLSGDLNASSISGDCSLQTVESSQVNLRCSGNMRLGFSNTAGNHNLAAEGDLAVYIPPQAAAAVKITSEGEAIRLRLADQTNTLRQRQHTLQLGLGGGTLTLASDGNVLLSDQPWMDNLEKDLDRAFSGQQAEPVRLHSGGRSGLNITISTDEIMQRVTRRAEEATRRAEERINSALNRLDSMPIPPASPAYSNDSGYNEYSQPDEAEVEFEEMPHEAVSDEERLMVLRMIQEKKISVEEAEKLLEAMEGKKY
ncbi:MAG TPA: hypothetical protein PKW33_01840 [Anaerolineaceae bacterium]|nr:hypothetical protein [Anaerolineaceae bacterium]HPN50300.1 hypothetical protein [Anaerolineaceae bacterium]